MFWDKTWSSNPYGFHQGIHTHSTRPGGQDEFLNEFCTHCLTLFCPRNSCCYLQSNHVHSEGQMYVKKLLFFFFEVFPVPLQPTWVKMGFRLGNPSRQWPHRLEAVGRAAPGLSITMWIPRNPASRRLGACALDLEHQLFGARVFEVQSWLSTTKRSRTTNQEDCRPPLVVLAKLPTVFWNWSQSVTVVVGRGAFGKYAGKTSTLQHRIQIGQHRISSELSQHHFSSSSIIIYHHLSLAPHSSSSLHGSHMLNI